MRAGTLAMAARWLLAGTLSGCGGHTDRDSGEPSSHRGDAAGTGGDGIAGAIAQTVAGYGGSIAAGGDGSGGRIASGGSGSGGVSGAGGRTAAGGTDNVGGTPGRGGATVGGASGGPGRGGAAPGGAGGAAGQGGVVVLGGAAGEAGDAGRAGATGDGGAGGVGGQAGEAGGGGTPIPDLCQQVSPMPPGCPCTDSSECDGMCLALADDPCEEGVTGICANPPSGGCVCELSESYTGILCVEREICPDARPEYPQSCMLVSQVCAYDTPAHERCWCMNRFGDPVWECAREDVDCPYSQPTPGSSCTGMLECFFATASSLAYRCTCTNEHWDCEMLAG